MWAVNKIGVFTQHFKVNTHFHVNKTKISSLTSLNRTLDLLHDCERTLNFSVNNNTFDV